MTARRNSRLLRQAEENGTQKITKYLPGGRIGDLTATLRDLERWPYCRNDHCKMLTWLTNMEYHSCKKGVNFDSVLVAYSTAMFRVPWVQATVGLPTDRTII